MVYCITCLPTGRRYVGYTEDLQKRIAKHQAQPMPRMVAAVQTYQPWHAHFSVDILQQVHSEAVAQYTEATYIQNWKLTGPQGYNTVAGSMAYCNRLKYLVNSGKLKRR